jgi:hypothetical protein
MPDYTKGGKLNRVKEWSVPDARISSLRGVDPWPSLPSNYPTSTLFRYPDQWCLLSPSSRSVSPPPQSLPTPVLLLPFWRIDPASTTFVSTESGLPGWSVPFLQIDPSKGGGTSSKAQMAWIRISSGLHPILPAAIPPRRYHNHPEKWGFPPTTPKKSSGR